jgi:hypothetical protein
MRLPIAFQLSGGVQMRPMPCLAHIGTPATPWARVVIWATNYESGS